MLFLPLLQPPPGGLSAQRSCQSSPYDSGQSLGPLSEGEGAQVMPGSKPGGTARKKGRWVRAMGGVPKTLRRGLGWGRGGPTGTPSPPRGRPPRRGARIPGSSARKAAASCPPRQAGLPPCQPRGAPATTAPSSASAASPPSALLPSAGRRHLGGSGRLDGQSARANARDVEFPSRHWPQRLLFSPFPRRDWSVLKVAFGRLTSLRAEKGGGGAWLP